MQRGNEGRWEARIVRVEQWVAARGQTGSLLVINARDFSKTSNAALKLAAFVLSEQRVRGCLALEDKRL